MGRGTHRGFITYEELSKSLGKRNLSDENLSQAFIHILNENVSLVEKKSDFKVLRKKENSGKEEGKTIEKSDDPIRMYLREMGGVELLSREGEIAIAKRIEAGQDAMISGLCESPLTLKAILDWRDDIINEKITLREVIDLDSLFDESPDKKALTKKIKEAKKKKDQEEKEELRKRRELEKKNSTYGDEIEDASASKEILFIGS